jgi:hypothetical protein
MAALVVKLSIHGEQFLPSSFSSPDNLPECQFDEGNGLPFFAFSKQSESWDFA